MVLEESDRIIDVQQLLVMRCADSRSRAPSVFRLVRGGWEITFVPDRESVHLLGLALREQSRIQTGIDSAGKEDADWNVRHFPQADRGSELGHEALDKLGLRNAYERLRVIPDIPISMFLNVSIRADAQPRPGPKFMDSPVQGAAAPEL